MKLFYRTDRAATDAILEGGFTSSVHLVDWPTMVGGDTLLVVDIPEMVVEEYEGTRESRRYRAFQVPARIVNVARIVRVHPRTARR